MPLHPQRYAELLGKRIEVHNSKVWLINTGWTGGPYGVGSRMPIPHTRAMINAVLDGKLDDVPMRKDPIFGVEIPTQVPDVPSDVLFPRDTWKDQEAYDAQALKLAGMFRDNFKKFSDQVSQDIKDAAPRAG
jgi:phosphoenolpyruvate carboxykinase (ATP)